jgi:cytochrome c oxidase cbb3-type subunit 4
MDINDVRATITVVSFVVFIGIFVWAWSGRRAAAFEEAARLPLEDDQPMHSQGASHE